jgi:hypothetical protein
MQVADVPIGSDVELNVSVSGGKIVVSVSYKADAELDKLKAALPAWAAPLIDLVKVEVDKV